ncbi:unnamed protein product [Closterium sp. NIES-53]
MSEGLRINWVCTSAVLLLCLPCSSPQGSRALPFSPSDHPFDDTTLFCRPPPASPSPLLLIPSSRSLSSPSLLFLVPSLLYPNPLRSEPGQQSSSLHPLPPLPLFLIPSLSLLLPQSPLFFPSLLPGPSQGSRALPSTPYLPFLSSSSPLFLSFFPNPLSSFPHCSQVRARAAELFPPPLTSTPPSSSPPPFTPLDHPFDDSTPSADHLPPLGPYGAVSSSPASAPTVVPTILPSSFAPPAVSATPAVTAGGTYATAASSAAAPSATAAAAAASVGSRAVAAATPTTAAAISASATTSYMSTTASGNRNANGIGKSSIIRLGKSLSPSSSTSAPSSGPVPLPRNLMEGRDIHIHFPAGTYLLRRLMRRLLRRLKSQVRISHLCSAVAVTNGKSNSSSSSSSTPLPLLPRNLIEGRDIHIHIHFHPVAMTPLGVIHTSTSTSLQVTVIHSLAAVLRR